MSRAPKICSHPRCPYVQPCPDHQKVAWAGSTRRQRLPRGWDKRRRYILERDPICRICNAVISAEVDHIVPGDDHSHENLQGVCKRCHQAKTQRESAAARGARS